MEDLAAICTDFLRCAYDFQVLISGVLAIAAAVITAGVIWRSAKLPFVEQRRRDDDMSRRRRLYAGSILAADFSRIALRAQQAERTIKVTISANANVNDDTRRKTTIEIDDIVENWEVMSALPSDLLQKIFQFRQLLSDHNFDIQNAGGAFGADNFRQSVLDRTRKIQSNARALSGAFMTLADDVKSRDSAV